MIWIKKETSLENFPHVDFSSSKESIERQIRTLLLARPIPTEDTSRKPDFRVAKFEVRYARGTILSENTLLLQEEPPIMLVDPISDLKDAFVHQAIDVNVVQMPHLYVDQNFIRQEVYPTEGLSNLSGVTNRRDIERNDIPTIPQIFYPGWTPLSNLRNSKLMEGWSANDFDDDYPDDTWMIYAPNSGSHDMWWYDYDNPQYCDWVLDWQMGWWDGNENIISAPDWFRQNSNYNLVHEIRANDSVYEAHSYISVDLPSVTHNEDSNWAEEQLDGYEEKEVGMDRPWEINPHSRYRLWTAWCPLNNGNSFFDSESELTKPSPITGNPWYPEDWDQLGRMVIYGAE